MAKNYSIDRLCSSIRASRRALEYFRATRRKFVREYVGRHYSEDGTAREVPVNLIKLYCRIIPPKLISRNPRVTISTHQFAAKETVAAMQTWANDQIERLYLAETLQRVVYDALFSIGVAKVGILTPAESDLYYGKKPGEVCVETISLDDWAFDPHCRDLRHAEWMGHRVRVPLEAVKQSKLYNRSRKELVASTDPDYNEQGDERLKQLFQGSHGDEEAELRDMVDLWEIWLKPYGVVVTLADSQVSGSVKAIEGEPLRVQKWVGPECGPYHWLALGTVPDNPMPSSPIQDQFGLHSSVNNLYRKLIEQGRRQKTITFVRAATTEQGDRLLKTSDGEAYACDDPEGVRELMMGGPNQGNFLLAQHFYDRWDTIAGNISLAGGLKPQSKTAAQDKMLNENSEESIADLAMQSTRYFAQIAENMCWWWHHHPYLEMKSHVEVPGLPELSVNRKPVTRDMRKKVPWDEMRVGIDPYTHYYKSPQQKVAELDQSVEMALKMMPFLQAQGIQIDLNAYFALRAKWLDQPELQQIISIVDPAEMMAPTGGEGGGGKMPAETERTYTRRSLGGEGPQEQGADLMNTLAAGMNNGQSNGQQALNTNGYSGGG